MAKVKLTSLLTELSGNVGGVIFARNKSCHTARKLVRPSPRETTQLVLRRAQAQNVIGFWQQFKNTTYTDPDYGLVTRKQGWDLWAAEPEQTRYNVFGDPYQPSGFNCYFEYAMYARAAGVFVISVRPQAPKPAIWNGFQLKWQYITTAGNSFFKAPTTSAAELARVFIRARIERGILKPRPSLPPYKFAASWNYGPANSEYDLEPAFNAQLGRQDAISMAFFEVRFWHQNRMFSDPVRFYLESGQTYTYTAPP